MEAHRSPTASGTSSSSAVTQLAGTSASRARSSMTRASCGLVWNPTPQGRGRPGSEQDPRSNCGAVQLPVDERPPHSAGIGQEHPQLAVVDRASRGRVLALHAHRGRSLLEESGLVDHQHRARVARWLHQVAAQVVTDLVSVPAGVVEQPLHPIRGCARRRAWPAGSELASVRYVVHPIAIEVHCVEPAGQHPAPDGDRGGRQARGRREAGEGDQQAVGVMHPGDPGVVSGRKASTASIRRQRPRPRLL
jgi:hypothetical protein